MTCRELVMSVIDDPAQKGYDMSIDDPRKLVAIAYYMGRESASRDVSDMYNALLRQQLNRADNCRYRHMAHAVQGDVAYIHHCDYSGDMTAMFGADKTNLTIDKLKNP